MRTGRRTQAGTGARGEARGVISVASVVVISVVALLAGIAFSAFSLSELQHAFFDQNAAVAFVAADSCVEEAILRLKRSSGYAGGSLAVGDATCGVTVASGTQKIITATSTFQGITRTIQARITLTGASASLNEWTQYDGF